MSASSRSSRRSPHAPDLVSLVEGAYSLDGSADGPSWLEPLSAERRAIMAAHLAAGMRLRRAAARAAAATSARGSTTERSLRGALREAAVAALRTSSGRAPEAPCAWSALIDGRWSLIDRFESDGARMLLAMPLASGIVDPRALTDMEKMLVGYVTRGYSNKLIAYEIGRPEGTVARRVAQIARKLDVPSRVGIIDRHASLQTARATELEVGGARLVLVEEAPVSLRPTPALTRAEREVAMMAARGASDQVIARARSSAVRTVSNILFGVYRKVGVSSRAELAVCLAQQ